MFVDFFFFNDTATTEIYTLSLHDALPICIEMPTAPEGYVKVHDNHHLWSKTRVGKAQADGQYEVVFETAELVEPDPFPEGYQ